MGVEKAFIPPGFMPRACRIVLCISPGNPRIDAKTLAPEREEGDRGKSLTAWIPLIHRLGHGKVN